MEKDSGGKLASLPPAKLNFSAKVTQIATGLQHTLLLTIHGEVYAFGSNNYGQLGLLDLNPRGIPTPVDLTPRGIFIVKFIYSEKAAKFCEIFTLLLSYVVLVKSKVKISQNFVAFSEYMNFTGSTS